MTSRVLPTGHQEGLVVGAAVADDAAVLVTVAGDAPAQRVTGVSISGTTPGTIITFMLEPESPSEPLDDSAVLVVGAYILPRAAYIVAGRFDVVVPPGQLLAVYLDAHNHDGVAVGEEQPCLTQATVALTYRLS